MKFRESRDIRKVEELEGGRVSMESRSSKRTCIAGLVRGLGFVGFFLCYIISFLILQQIINKIEYNR